MKLASFINKSTGTASIGAVLDDGILDLHAASGGELPNAMIPFLELGEAGMARARELAAAGGDLLSADDIELQAPVPRPGKIMHTSCNFSAHLEELTTWQEPEWQSHNWSDFHFEHPTGFLEAPSSVVPHGASVKIPHFTQQLDYEIEIGVIIGKKGFRIPKEEAFDYVAGLTIFNDLSARDIQAREHSNMVILLGKSFDGSCPLGPYLVTMDEIDDPDNMKLNLTLNGEERQNSSTANMVYKIAEMVAWWSNTTLEPGDVLTTGSPPGVISGMRDPVYLKPGDQIDCTVEHLGTLTTHIVE
ncbi:fumarylacetoacetate hydrolase family protein [Elongatibacter sediminis]|uniref:Fumarylacetoacetate hydrolase family protein n=1 Tax=Elongatibacter sediminis TaxID=3119006 RepID=A0AAW9R9I9_9GAMM